MILEELDQITDKKEKIVTIKQIIKELNEEYKQLAQELLDEGYNESQSVGDFTVYTRETVDYEYMSDPIREKYLEMVDEANKTLKEYKQSLKNREDLLQRENKALIKSRNKTLVVR